jgi:molecular chaperone GrpE
VTEGNGRPKDDAADAVPGQGLAAAEEPEATGLAPAEPSAADVEALRRERDDFRDQLLRKRADFENFRRRVERDRAQAGQDAVASLVEALIPGFDNLERALSTDSDEGALRRGVELIDREFRSILEAQGVTIDDPLGKRFDPEIHHALSHEAVPGVEDGIVVEVYRKAYFLKGRLLRPALVKVAKGDGPQATAEGGQEPVH